MSRVVGDAEPILDQLDHPGAGPQVGREAGFTRPGDDAIDELVDLLFGELPLAAGVRLSGEAVVATLTPSTPPAFRAAAIDTETLGHRADGLPCLEARRSATASSFQLRRTALRSHAPYYGASDTQGSFAAPGSIGRDRTATLAVFEIIKNQAGYA